jgi:K+-transporting ATPase KdpC subunit
MKLRRQIRPLLVIFGLMALLLGIICPLIVTGIAQTAFAKQANGSLILVNGQPVGSELIGQQFTSPRYFWGRLSATSPDPYNGAASSGSNLGPSSPDLQQMVAARIAALQAADPGNTAPIPVDLVTASGSGLDPDISIAAALYQLPRVARERGLNEDQVRVLVDQFTQGRQFGIFGEPRVNVLELNLALDALK